MTLQPIYETVGSTLVGVVVAAIIGVAPAAGAGMALLASLVTRAAEPALRKLPTFEEDGTKRGCAAILVIAAWIASTTQVTQIFLRYAGYSVPFFSGTAIVSASVIIGGRWLVQVINQQEVWE